MSDVRWAHDGSDLAVASFLADRIGKGARRLAVPGGSTPVSVFERLTQFDLPWSELRIDLVDDRIVPADHSASNYGLLARAFAGKPVSIAPLVEGARTSHFDLVWLGMGTDGHIASIFPGNDLTIDFPATVVRARPDPLPKEAPFERLTMTMAALTDADEIIVVARGEAKRAIIETALAGGGALPISAFLARATSPVTIFWSE